MASMATAGTGALTLLDSMRRRRRGFSVLSCVIVLVVVGMLIAVLLPSLCQPRETANKAKCASNLHQIGLAILLYAKENGGHYPPSLAVLPGQERITPEAFICPSSNDEKSSAAETAGVVAELTAAETNAPGHKHCLSYIYAGRGLTVDTAKESTIVAYEPLTNHDDGTNVLFSDGHAEWISRSAWPKLAAAAGLAAEPSPTTRP